MESVPPPQAAPEVAPEELPADVPPWPLWTAPAAVLLGLGLGQVVIIVVDIVGRAGGSSLSHPTPAVNIIGNLMFDLAFVAAALYFVRQHGGARAADFGYRAVPLSIGALAFVLAGASYYVISFAYTALINVHGTDKLPKDLGVDRSTVAAAAVTVFVCVVAPIAEEFFFRGFLFGALRRWRIRVSGHELGTWVAAVITGLLFGVAHTGTTSAVHLIQLAIFGFILCIVRWRTGSLYPCMALHSFNNALAMGVSQFHWNVAEILALWLGSLVVIGAITGPLSTSRNSATAFPARA
jgi:CAAX protease family protein